MDVLGQVDDKRQVVESPLHAHTRTHMCARCGESMVEHTCTHNDHDLQHQHPQHHDAEDSAAHLIDRPHAVVDEVGRHEERKRENDRVVLAVRV